MIRIPFGELVRMTKEPHRHMIGFLIRERQGVEVEYREADFIVDIWEN
jgi:hypothetical protein